MVRHKSARKIPASISVAGFAFAALALAQTANAVNVVGDANAETAISPSNTVIKMTQSGTLTVTEPGEIEILLVGGGGGGGGGAYPYYGGGGGAGGVVHKSELFITNGVYDIVIGAGGAVGANGGMTTAFGLTAWGGGHGATGGGANAASGASGGGGAGRQWWNDGLPNSKGAEANPAYANVPYCNLGYAGSDAPYATECSGGGGGAGGPAGAGTPDTLNATHLARPGVAYICAITGVEEAYAGGGGGCTWGNLYTTPGGGKNSFGGGGNSNGVGGPGVLIVRFTRSVAKETAFDDATGGTSTTCRVGDRKYRVHTFAQSGQFAIPHHGHVEVLVVGGGGGGGGGAYPYYGGGGGAGGVVHKSELFITNGVYDIVIGAGGAVGANGGMTTAFGLTAWGGGHGATGGGANAASGASGGGGAGRQWWNDGLPNSKGAEANPAYANVPYCNLGYAGSDAPYATECSGGGGGAGGPAGAGTPDTGNGTHLARPGAAYICAITGGDAAYAGGGSGRNWNTFYKIDGGGKNSYGGGGNSNDVGGGGVVIIRHQMPMHGMAIVVQ